MRKKSILTAVFSLILSLFLAISLFAVALCVYARNTLCREDLMTDTLVRCGYSQQLYEEILYKWENLLAICGVPESENSTILQVLTPEGVKQDTLTYFQNSYQGSGTLDTQPLSDNLEALVRSYAYSNNIYMSSEEELDANIADLVEACMEEYHNSVQVPLMPRLLSKLPPLRNVLMWGTLATGAAALVFGVFLFFLQKKRQNVLYYGGIATGTNAVLILALFALARGTQLIYRLPITESALRTFLIAYLERLLESFLLLGLLFLGITAVLALVYFLFSLLKRKSKTV